MARISVAQTTGAYVCLYSQADFNGEEYCTTTNTGFVPLRVETRSVRVAPRYQARLFKLPFYLGESTDLQRNTADFTKWAGTVRSIRISEKPQTVAHIVPMLHLLLGEDIDPNDWDGDGFSNELEDEYGTDPRDPNSTPPDIDGDKIPDDVDPDRDGDGVDNDVEVDNSTDPNDPNDYPDLVDPVLTVENSTPLLSADSMLIIRGHAIDPMKLTSGFKEVTVKSSRFADNVFRGNRNETTGDFEIEVPLALGLNELNVVASDNWGNRVSITLQVTRQTVPTFENLLPVNGTVTTEATVDISGVVRTSFLPTDFVLEVNESRVDVSATSEPGVYAFDFENLQLEVGENRFHLLLSSQLGGVEQTLLVRYLPEIGDEIRPPIISGVSPPNGAVLNTPSFTIVANLESLAGPLSVTLDGASLLDRNLGRSTYTLSEELTFGGGQAQLTTTIEAEDALGKLTTQTLAYYLDMSGPTITLDQPYLSDGVQNQVTQSNLTLSGVIRDDNLSGVLVNDQSLTLTPGNAPGEYRFELTVPVGGSTPVPVAFNAYDRSGNTTVVEYVFINTSPAQISALLPGPDTTVVAREGFALVQIVAQLTGQVADLDAFVYLSSDTSSQQPMSVSGDRASTELSVPDTAEQQTIVYELRDAAGNVVGSDSRVLNVQRFEDIPVELVRIEPANNQRHVEPNSPIEVYFNRAIDPTLLEVTVRETFNGKTYLNADALGEDFIYAQGYVLSDVNRNLETVTGQTDMVPGNTSAVFSASRYFAYDADLFVEVKYDNQSLSRSRFKVRELPTFVNGSVSDQFGQPLKGISVSLLELARSTTTNGDGGFTFGYQESGDQTLPGGSYTLVVNDEFGNPRFGTIRTTIHLQPNRINPLSKYTLQELDRNVPFANLNSGAANTLLDGDLLIDLSEARLIFPNSRTAGPVHAQFLPFEHLGVGTYQSAMPHWLYSIQPKGISVEGNIALNVAMPRLRGSYDYINLDVYQHVVLLGYSGTRQIVEPIGVGRIENYRVTSVGKVHAESLDYLGYAIVVPDLLDELGEYANGQISIEQLKAALQTQTANGN
ncbi:carboxypeptidase regulatory-like domain-containing protein [Arenicella chitinivorans]|uniref:carboxypeptidase regulatory-like domain-containing protein n=1 Tax=Arenicella chitinivorans TaxID=1329800 RepID=UPI001673A925|nr:carboxypeptidase regulatory-like domain-containing protein [Arenicella chitinivorans]